MRMFAPMIVASCLLIAAMPASAQKAGQPSPEPDSAPGLGQKLLEKMAGSWEVTKVYYPRQGDPIRTSGQCRSTMIQNGRFLQTEFEFNQAEGKTTGLGIIGFEPETGRFTSFWVDSRQTRASVRQGKEPFDGQKIVLYSVSLDPQSKDSRHSKTISYLEDNGRKLVHRQYALGTGTEERLVMELIMTRRLRSPRLE